MATTHTRLLKQIGIRIKELRALQGFTQEELAEKSNLFRTYIGRVEGGLAGQVSIVALHQIAKAFKLPLAALLEEAKSEPPRRVDPTKKISRGRITK